MLERMQSKVDLLKEDQHEIVNELTENSAEIENIVEKVRNEGNLADADKLKLHIDELESVTSLITVLKVRLKTTENKLEVTKDSKEKVEYHQYIKTDQLSHIVLKIFVKNCTPSMTQQEAIKYSRICPQ